MQCIEKDILKDILLVKYKVLQPLEIPIEFVFMDIIYNLDANCRNGVLFSHLYLS